MPAGQAWRNQLPRLKAQCLGIATNFSNAPSRALFFMKLTCLDWLRFHSISARVAPFLLFNRK